MPSTSKIARKNKFYLPKNKPPQAHTNYTTKEPKKLQKLITQGQGP